MGCGVAPFVSSLTFSYPRTVPPVALFSNGSFNTRCGDTRKVDCNGLLHSGSTLSPVPKGDSIGIQNIAFGNVGTVGLELQRPYEVSFGKFTVQEAVLDEEYWAAAWLRAEIYSEEQPYVRFIDSYRKRFAEQEFTALKRRCIGRQGQCIKCICLVAVTAEESQDGIGKFSHYTLRDRVVGTLDISIRQLLRGETFPKEVANTSLLANIEPERRCGYIANVCVSMSARRQGIASSLLEVAVTAAKSWNLKDLYVHVNISNIAAQCLYRKTGFQVVEEALSDLCAEQKQLLSMCI